MTTSELITGILAREGGDAFTNDPADRGGPTKYGITAQTLGRYRQLGRPATLREVARLTEAEAREIYAAIYVAPFDWCPFDDLRAQLADFAVTSGTQVAVKALQRALGVEADGLVGDRTRTALVVMPWKLTNAALVAQRCKVYSDLAEAREPDRKFLRGWIARACAFLV